MLVINDCHLFFFHFFPFVDMSDLTRCLQEEAAAIVARKSAAILSPIGMMALNLNPQNALWGI